MELVKLQINFFEFELFRDWFSLACANTSGFEVETDSGNNMTTNGVKHIKDDMQHGNALKVAIMTFLQY